MALPLVQMDDTYKRPLCTGDTLIRNQNDAFQAAIEILKHTIPS